jgi:hypothetical protein
LPIVDEFNLVQPDAAEDLLRELLLLLGLQGNKLIIIRTDSVSRALPNKLPC